VSARNGSSVTVTELDMIDILPFNGDSSINFRDITIPRNPATTFHGSRKFEEMELIAHPQSPGVCDLSPGIKYYYTKENPQNINMSPKDTSNQNPGSNGSIWCEGTTAGPDAGCGFSKAEVTAIRATGPSMGEDGVCQLKFKMSLQDNKPDDFYNNSAGASATGVTLPVVSNAATVVIVKSSLGNYVWFDVNSNGIQDDGEEGINDINVSLYKSDGTLVASTKTKDDDNGKAGYYKFDNLHSGDYYIKVSPPARFNISPKDAGSDDEKDSDIDTSGKSDIIHLGVATEDSKWDAGIYKPSSIGDTIWFDANKNGIQDSGEDCRGKSVQVELLDSSNSVLQTQNTQNCKYGFENLNPGSYKVRFTLPNGYKVVEKGKGTDREIDSDIDPTTKTSDTVILNNGNDRLDIDFGFYTDASIGDLVWIDKNGNGIQDSDEAGVDGVKVELLDSSDNIIDTKTTANGGKYLFDNLLEGDYRVRFTLPDGYLLSANDKGSDDTKDSDVSSSLVTPTITLTSGTSDLKWDMGVYKNASIGDRVWVDSNGNGIQDDGEDCQGLSVEIALLDKDNRELNKTTTTNCNYKFENLRPGDYKIKVKLPQSYNATNSNLGDEAKDSDVDPLTNMTSVYTLTSGEENSDVDIGMLKDGSIGNRVWFDDNKNGIQDDGEDGVEGVVVKLLKDGEEINQTKTSSNGTYLFSNLRPANYGIKIELPTGYKLSPKDAGSDDEKDSDIDASSLQSSEIFLQSGVSNLSLDAGIYTEAKITGHVRVDIDDDDKAEKPLKGVEVRLSGCKANSNKTTTTDDNGYYEFKGLIPGCYKVTEIDPKGYTSVSDVDGVNDNNITVNLKDKDINGRDFLDEPLLKISGHVRADMDFDGDIEVESSKDINLKDVEITLYKDDKNISTVRTDSNGFYQFSEITPGVYTIKESDPKGFDSLRDVDGENDNTIKVVVSEQDIVDRDFDDQKTILVSGKIEVDIDGDRVVDRPLKNTQLLLCFDGDECSVESNLATTYTDENGTYEFAGLKPGNYVIVEVDKPGYESLSDIDGGDLNMISLSIDGTKDIEGQDFKDLAIAPKFIIINKSVAKKEVSVGNFVPYTIEVENSDNSFNYAAVKIRDVIPAGFKYEKGSARILRSGKKSPIKATGVGTIEFGEFRLKAKEKVKISYILKVGVGVAQGKHTNRAIAVQNGEEISNLSSADVTVVADPFIDNAIVVGKVFEDKNSNGIQDKGERGIPGVRLATVDGMVIETDGYGRYHIADVDSGGFASRGKNFIVKVDPATLPEGAKFTTENPRVYRITAGGLNTINFGVKLPKAQRVKVKTAPMKKVVKRVEVKKLVEIGSIYFDSDQDCIRPDQIKKIKEIARKIKEYGHGSIMIEGNTDARAPLWYNKKLAYKRAKSVYEELKHILGDSLIDRVDVIYNDCQKEVKFDPRYDWWGKPYVPRTKKECSKFGVVKKDCKRGSKGSKGGAL
jgi:uncharacterized repeat protein (TIGR01451 family)